MLKGFRARIWVRAAGTGAEARTVIGEYPHEDEGKEASKWDLCQQQHAEKDPCG